MITINTRMTLVLFFIWYIIQHQLMEHALFLSQFIKIKLREMEWLSQITELINGKIRFEVEGCPKLQKDAQGNKLVIIYRTGVTMYICTFILHKPHGHKKSYKDILMCSFKLWVLGGGFISANIYWNHSYAELYGKTQYESNVASPFKELSARGRMHRKNKQIKHTQIKWMTRLKQ